MTDGASSQEQSARPRPGAQSLPRELVAEGQRARIHAAVLDLVAEQGYGTTTVDEIAKRAVVSKATLYSHFTNREDCFWSATDESFQALVHAIDEGFATGGDVWVQQVRGALRGLLHFLDTHRSFGRVLFIEALAAGKPGLARHDHVLAALRQLFDPERQAEVAAMDLPRAELRAAAAVDVIAGKLFALMLQDETEDLPARLDEFVWDAMLPFGGEPSA